MLEEHGKIRTKRCRVCKKDKTFGDFHLYYSIETRQVEADDRCTTCLNKALGLSEVF